jgi:hypothetical protein
VGSPLRGAARQVDNRDPGGPKGVVFSALGVAQTLAWASTYYLTAVFADPVSADLHLPRTWFFGTFSAALPHQDLQLTPLVNLKTPPAGWTGRCRGGTIACTIY